MTDKVICEKARECKEDCIGRKPHDHRFCCGKRNLSSCPSPCPSPKTHCIPIEEIGYTLHYGSDCCNSKCPYSKGFLNIATAGGCTKGDWHTSGSCPYFMGIDKDKQVIWCTYKAKEGKLMEKKYEPQKEASIYALYNAEPKELRIRRMISDIVHHFGLNEIIPFDMLMASARTHNGIHYLLLNNFIREVKEEVFYKKGDKFSSPYGDWTLNYCGIKEYVLNDDQGNMLATQPMRFYCDKNDIPASDFHAWAGYNMVKI